MNVFTAMTVIAIVYIVAEMIKYVATAKTRHLKSSANNQQAQELTQEVAKLKERVSTLEAIVTDKNYDLSKEIDRL